MTRAQVSGGSLVACGMFFVTVLNQGVLALVSAASRSAASSPGSLESYSSSTGFSPSGAVVAIAALLLIARLANYLRPSGFLVVAAALMVLADVGGLLAASTVGVGLLTATGVFAVAIAGVVSLLVVAQDITGSRGAGLGVWTAMAPLGAVGAALVAAAPAGTWRPAMWATAMLGAVLLVYLLRMRPIEPVSTFAQFDLLGAGLWFVGLAAVLSGSVNNSTVTTVFAGLGVVALAGLVIWTHRARAAGFIPTTLLARPGVLTAVAGLIVSGLAVSFTDVMARPLRWAASPAPTQIVTAASVIAPGAAAAVFGLVAGHLVDRRLGLWALAGGGGMLVAGLALTMAPAEPVNSWALAAALALVDAGWATIVVWLLYTAFDGVPRSLVATVAGMLMTALAGAGLLGGAMAVRSVETGVDTGFLDQIRPVAFPLLVVVFAVLAVVRVVIGADNGRRSRGGGGRNVKASDN